jgi:uronate dehydrogenase
MQGILITGAAGQIGKALRPGLRGSYPLVRLLDFAPLSNRRRRSRRYMPR